MQPSHSLMLEKIDLSADLLLLLLLLLPTADALTLKTEVKLDGASFTPSTHRRPV